jgi:GPH family glycoside/pentoside/hexuronide:cation symporter
MIQAIRSLKLREKIGYGFGDAASSMFWKMFTMYLIFFYTDIFGIPAAVVGTMFLFVRLWDAINDPMMGIIADRTNSRWGKFRPYLLWVAVPFGIIGVLTFTTPGFSVQGKIIYAYITYTLMMMVYTAINVPYASLMGVMSSVPEERTTLASYRFVFAFGGSILALAFAKPLADLFSKSGNGTLNPQFGWQMATVVFAVITTVFFWLTFSWTREYIKPIKTQKTSIWRDLKDMGSNIPWFILLGAAIFTLIFNSLRDSSIMYYFKYYVSDSKAFSFSIFSKEVLFTYSTIYMVLGQVCNILGVILARPVSDRIGKKQTFFIAMLLASFLSFTFYFFTARQVYLIFTAQALISICAGIIFPLLWSMYADIADYSEWKTGRRATGLIFSSSSMSQKFGWTLGGAVTGWLLAIYGFKANVVQSAETLTGIRLIMSVFPGIGALVSAVFVFFYRLDKDFVKNIEKDLAVRREGD